jgi:hypothetical protein
MTHIKETKHIRDVNVDTKRSAEAMDKETFCQQLVLREAANNVHPFDAVKSAKRAKQAWELMNTDDTN